MTPLDGSIEAVYADGWTYSETERGDASLYAEGRNVFYDVLNKLPEAEHGTLTSFSVFWKNQKYTVDWNGLLDNARPIRFKKMEMDYNGPLAGVPRMVGVDFGFQYTDENGKNVQEVMELR